VQTEAQRKANEETEASLSAGGAGVELQRRWASDGCDPEKFDTETRQKEIPTAMPCNTGVAQGRGCAYERTREEGETTAATNKRLGYPEPFMCWTIIFRLATQAWQIGGGGNKARILWRGRHAYSPVHIVSDELITYSFSCILSNEFL
jgi:hypothetical protein